MDIQFTSSQQSAINAFKTFLKSDDQVFILRGAAGTGKTTILKEFVRILSSRARGDMEHILTLLAPTGRAAHILHEKTGCLSSTIHRYIYDFNKLESNNLSKDEQEDDTLHLYFALKSNHSRNDIVYFVDEASMVSDIRSDNEYFSFGSGFLLSDLFQYSAGRKMVFVGDYAQLPPIGMNFSPALDKKYMEDKFKCGISEFTLTEVLRQNNDSLILKNATEIRNNIERKQFVEFKLKSGDCFKNVDTDLLEPYYALSQSQPSSKGVIVTHTNQQSVEYNNFIREHFFGKDADLVKKGDLMLISRNNYNYDVELFNGTIVKILACQPDIEAEKRLVRIKLGREKYKDIDLSFRNVTIAFRYNGEPKQLSVKLLDNYITDPSANISGDISRAVIVDFNQRLPQEIRTHLHRIKNVLRGKTENDSRIRELAKLYTELIRKDAYYNAVICKYGYAMTCHKAQGGEWENVFVDMFRYGGTNNESYFRWAYTAITRSSKNLWYYRAPDFDFISGLTVSEPQSSGKVRVSIYGENENYVKNRFERVTDLANIAGIDVEQDLTKNYQQIITFRSNGQQCQIRLWYGKDGYKSVSGDISQSSNDTDFDTKCLFIIRESFAPEIIDIPLDIEDRPFFGKLARYVKNIAEQHKIKLLNITHEQFQDVFHLLTDDFAKVYFSYDCAGKYTYMKTIGSIAANDAKLIAFRDEFL